MMISSVYEFGDQLPTLYLQSASHRDETLPEGMCGRNKADALKDDEYHMVQSAALASSVSHTCSLQQCLATNKRGSKAELQPMIWQPGKFGTPPWKSVENPAHTAQ
jgi:hypothetical protein